MDYFQIVITLVSSVALIIFPVETFRSIIFIIKHGILVPVILAVSLFAEIIVYFERKLLDYSETKNDG